jgi:hypothetical protein
MGGHASNESDLHQNLEASGPQAFSLLDPKPTHNHAIT